MTLVLAQPSQFVPPEDETAATQDSLALLPGRRSPAELAEAFCWQAAALSLSPDPQYADFFTISLA